MTFTAEGALASERLFYLVEMLNQPGGFESFGLRPIEDYAQQCHAASLAIVKSDMFAGLPRRVARGTCKGVSGQHSWVVVGADSYDPVAYVLDVTLWSYDPEAPKVLAMLNTIRHRPHGFGSIWEWGCPEGGVGEIIELNWLESPSGGAKSFLEICQDGGNRADRKFWAALSSAPVGGWPAREIYAAMENTPEVNPLLPIDKVGMLTEMNPGGLYLHPDGLRAGARAVT
jgi:hypothetical protein